MEKVWIYIKFRQPSSPDDRDYKTILMHTVVDVDKIFKGVYTNFVMKAIMDIVTSGSLDFELKLPFPPVR